MSALGIVQKGDPRLRRRATPFHLPANAAMAREAEEILIGVGEQVRALHPFTEGPGLNAVQLALPQCSLRYATAVAYMPETGWITLYNPKIIRSRIGPLGSNMPIKKWEGCLSFFDERGMVPRLERITVSHILLDGTRAKSTYEGALARLIAHEIDHLNGKIYTDYRNVVTTPVEEYRRIRAAEQAALGLGK
ncbi:peptide deformylase [Nocardia sp. NPDC058058]|uniref:peptide deformylase n=1 Tax=Nocardia sp. NPDC058058 TaxID=3346317 RepID=UPI0036DC3560